MSQLASSAWNYMVRGAQIDCEYLNNLTPMGTQRGSDFLS
jgi:hypothetical protein